MIRYLIVDDEPLAHDLIIRYAGLLPHLELSGRCYDAFEAAEFLHRNPVDLIFLDINMPQLSGFDFLRSLPTPPRVIVTSAYQEYALEGYDLNVADYLLKPFGFDRFLRAVNKAISSGSPSVADAPVPVTNARSFFVKGDKKYHQVSFDRILFVEAARNNTKLFTEDGPTLCQEGISTLEQLLGGDGFLRVHKSFIVAIDRIKTIEGNRIYIGEHEIPIGATYRAAVNRLLPK